MEVSTPNAGVIGDYYYDYDYPPLMNSWIASPNGEIQFDIYTDHFYEESGMDVEYRLGECHHDYKKR